ncbi:hypothetical protein QOZ80_7AG0572770 [Eleusine coracana subsp. coracana]|nr:hypothetical protein QOZ80_7AG0572770 [Eleusine coracana subsp. coracana]
MGYERTVKAATVATAVGALAAAAARFLGPAVADGLPRAREAAAAWMTPPYLYIVINAIIISIAASSRFQPGSDRRSAGPEPEHHVAAVEIEAMPLEAVPAPVPVVQAAELVPAEDELVVKGKKNKPAPAPKLEKKEEEEGEEFSISRSSWTPRRRGAEPMAMVVVDDKDAEEEGEAAPPFADLTNSREKPLASGRFNRKPAKAKPSPEGSKALRVARQRKEETLESTWKAITEGRAPPLARHLKKSDTWDTRPGRRPSGSGELDAAAPAPAPPATAMRKAETFNDGRSKAPVRREPSLGQDELNRRVEAFINKFNMEMRLQRQESLKYHQEMLRLGRDGLY